MNSPLLSVCLITYNHGKYICPAIESVLMQKVNFTWELIIADDCSTDDTREILIAYQKKYPDFIKLILQEKNVGAAQNWMDLVVAPTSKYIAYLEGDDYWTNPNKLQMQIDFLEQHPKYSACIHNSTVLRDEVEIGLYHDWTQDKDVEAERIIINGGGVFPSASLVYRNVIKIEQKDLEFQSGDTVLILLLLTKGPVYYMHQNMCVYRRHNQGLFTSLKDNPANRVEFLVNNILLYKYYRKFLDKKYNDYINNAILLQVKRIYNIYGYFSKQSLILLKYLTLMDMIRFVTLKLKSKSEKK